MARRKTADGQTGLFENAGSPHPARDAGHLPPRGKALRKDEEGGRTMFAPTGDRGRGVPRAESGPRNDKKAEDGSVWEMKKRGSVGVISTVPFCGYSEATLRSLKERGWHLYKDGKRVD